FAGRYRKDYVRRWRDRNEITNRIVRQLFLRNRMNGNDGRDRIKQRVIVVGSQEGGDADHPVGSRPVFHDDGLSPALGESLRKEPGAEIRTAPPGTGAINRTVRCGQSAATAGLQ